MSTASITAQQWKEIEERLSYPGASAYLQCDQYLVTIRIGVHKMRMYFLIYVDGWMKGEWMTTDCDIRRRFLCPVKDNVFKGVPTKFRRGKPYISKKDKKKYEFTYYVSSWRSFSSMRKHFLKNNSAIERLSVEEGCARIERLVAVSRQEEATHAN